MEIAQGVYSLGQKEGGRVHAFLLDDGKELTLIDTLFDTDGKRILDQIQKIGRQASDLKHIILTHAHRSHLGGATALQKLTGATVYAHEYEADIIAGERKAQGVGFKPQRPLRSWFRSTYPLQIGLNLGWKPHPPCRIDRAAKDGDRIGPLQVMYSPGHSPGHLAFYWQERRALFAGDAIATYPELGPGWPVFNLNPQQHRASLDRMAQVDVDVVGVGHGEPITSGGTATVRGLLKAFKK